jgi:ankyrin repeat protein
MYNKKIVRKLKKIKIFNYFLMNIFELIRKKEINRIKELISMNEIDVNIQNSFGNTPLHIACMEGESEIVKFLLISGANPNIKNIVEDIFLFMMLFIINT